MRYKEVHKEVKRSIRSDKRNYLEQLATEAEEAACKGNLNELYKITKTLSGKQVTTPRKDKEGKVLTNTDDQLKRWAEHFKELLNRPAPSTTPEIFPAEVDLDISCERPSKKEIRRAIKHLKSGKAAGHDHIPPEALKADINTTVEILYKLFEAIWIEEINNFIGTYCPKGVGHERDSRSHARCPPASVNRPQHRH